MLHKCEAQVLSLWVHTEPVDLWFQSWGQRQVDPSIPLPKSLAKLQALDSVKNPASKTTLKGAKKINERYLITISSICTPK